MVWGTLNVFEDVVLPLKVKMLAAKPTHNTTAMATTKATRFHRADRAAVGERSWLSSSTPKGGGLIVACSMSSAVFAGMFVAAVPPR